MTDKKLKFFMLFIVIALCLISPVMGETGTLNFDYEEYTGADSSASCVGAYVNGVNVPIGKTIYFTTIEDYQQLTHIVMGISDTNKIYGVTDDYSQTSGETTFSSTYGDGTVYWYRTIINGTSHHAVLTFDFDSWDIGTSTGAKTVTLTFGDEHETLAAWGEIPDRVTFSTDLSLIYTSAPGFIYEQELTAYQSSSIHQSIDYITDVENRLIEMDYNRGGYTNAIVVTDQTEEIRYSDLSNNNRDINLMGVDYVYITISNPVRPDTPFNEYIYIIETPTETPTETPDGLTQWDYTINDGVDTYKKLTAHFNIEQSTDLSTYTEYSNGTCYNGDLSFMFENGYYYRLTFSMNGYNDKVITYHTYPEEFEGYLTNPIQIYLYPDYGDNITITIVAYDEDTNLVLPGTLITFDSETKTADSGGKASWENVTPGEYTYSATKTGYISETKTETISTDSVKYLKLHEITNTAYVTYSFYDATTGAYLSVDYDILQKQNGIYQTLSEYNLAYGGTFAEELEVGFDYRFDISADGYKDEQILITPLIENVWDSLTLYPLNETENYSTIVFSVRDTDDNPLYGVKVSGFGTDQYTATDGKTSFYWSNDLIVTYTIYKEGYQKITGTENITENKILNFVMYEDGESPIPTENPSEDLENPSDIIGSIKYGLAKIFGFETSTTEGLENTNWVLALIIVMGAMGIVASKTKDGLGAIVGAAIGFLISVGIGLIPLWILFVSIGGICIYIILFKDKGE